MNDENPLRYCLTGDSAEITDQILGPIMQGWIGRNDMSIASGLLASAAIIITVHCQRTGDDFEELAGLSLKQYHLALKVAGDKVFKT